ncbi:MAG: efflux RND transporter periplasmic adaptor subunit [Chlorobium sp.]|nr:MAG: HlyD family efflux transporter periplasmic adaptor subunit [Chlorobium sp.]
MALEFRKEALKKLSSPDDLDRLMPVTDSRGWIAMIASGVLLAAALVWGFFGNIQTVVQGEGIFTKVGYINNIPALTSGVIKDIAVKGGDSFTKGQILARIEQPELRHTYENALLESQSVHLHQKEQVAFLQKTITSLAERVTRMNRLFQDGRIDKGIVTGVEQELMVAKKQLYDLEEKALAVSRKTDVARSNYQQQCNIIAPFSGIVTEREFNNGDFIRTGEGAFEVEESGKVVTMKNEQVAGDSSTSLVFVMYVTAEMVKKVQPGMLVYVASSTVKPEEYGNMVGQVIFISQYPKTYHSIVTDFNEDLAKRFTAQGSPYRVKVKIQPDKSTFSGFRWTSGKGPRTIITSGILGNGLIAIDNQRPIDLVIPLFKKNFLGQTL